MPSLKGCGSLRGSLKHRKNDYATYIKRDAVLHRCLSDVLSILPRHGDDPLFGKRWKTYGAQTFQINVGLRGNVPHICAFHADQYAPSQAYMPRMCGNL